MSTPTLPARTPGESYLPCGCSERGKAHEDYCTLGQAETVACRAAASAPGPLVRPIYIVRALVNAGLTVGIERGETGKVLALVDALWTAGVIKR